MADVFLSYKSNDRGLIELLVGVLRDQNLTVWFDQGLGGDEDYARQIEEQIAAAGVVVVVWSVLSRESKWVRAEADAAHKANKLLNVMSDGTLPPLPFNGLNATDLSAWRGDADDRRIAALLQDIRRILGRAHGGAMGQRPLPDDLPAARAWLHLQDSLDPRDYRDFLAAHPDSPQAAFAREHLAQLEKFLAIKANDAEAFHRFLISGPFAALGSHAKAERDRARAEPAKRAARDAEARQARRAQAARGGSEASGMLLMLAGGAGLFLFMFGAFIPGLNQSSIDPVTVLMILGASVIAYLIGYYRWRAARRR